jgi:succinate dehydrogenase/fumarate reductase flavoprotein subunit
MKTSDRQTDVIIIGAGLAGMMAACAAEAEGTRVLLLDRSSLGMGTNSALSNGVFAGPSPDYPPDQYVEDTLRIGRALNRKSWVEQVAREAPAAIASLKSFGLETRHHKDHVAVQPAPPGTIPGVTLVRRISEKIRSLDHIRIRTGFQVTEILCNNHRAVGIRGFDDRGEDQVIMAPTLILAAGGFGAVYLRNDNQRSALGQGYALAARAGLDLWDMEFVQFYPLVLAEPGLFSMLLYPPYPKESRLINQAGQDLLEKFGIHSLHEAIMQLRDAFSVKLQEELVQSGPVYLDYRGVPAASWGTFPLTLLSRQKFDFRHKPFAVAPAAHFCMGGLRTDGQGQTDLPGLYACGEMVWGLHGANRRGGNALLECLVSGRLAGSRAAISALASPPVPPGSAPAGKGFAYAPVPTFGPIRTLHQALKEIAWRQAGVVRDGSGLKSGLARVEALEEEMNTLRPHDLQERRSLADLQSALLTVRAVLTAGLGREESRGSFIRRDFPGEDNSRWRKNSRLRYLSETKGFSPEYEQAEC